MKPALRFLSVVVFFAILFITILFAEGYQYDLRNKDLVKKSVIYFESLPKDSSVFMDGKKIEFIIPGEIRASPGFHDIEIKREAYVSWKKRIKLEEDQVARFAEIMLFPRSSEGSFQDFPIKILASADAFEISSLSKEGIFLINKKLHFGKYYELKPGGRFWIKELPLKFYYKDLTPISESKFIGIADDGRLFLYDSGKGGIISRGGSGILDVGTEAGRIFALDKNGKIFLLKENLLARDSFLDSELYFSLPVPARSFEQIQESGGYFLFLLAADRADREKILVVAESDGSIVFQEGGVDAAFLEEGKAHFAKNGRLFAYSLKEKRFSADKPLSKKIIWFSRIGFSYRFLFLSEDRKLSVCDEDFENCADFIDLDHSFIASSEDNKMIFGISSGNFISAAF